MAPIRKIVQFALFACLTGVASSPLHAQGGFEESACPLILREKFLGFLPMRHEGAEWPGEWKLRLNSADSGLMRDDEGYYVPKDGPNIISLDGSKIWRNAGIIVRCTREEWIDLGVLRAGVEFRVTKFLGTVSDNCPSGSGGGGGGDPIQMVSDTQFDPYDAPSVVASDGSDAVTSVLLYNSYLDAWYAPETDPWGNPSCGSTDAGDGGDGGKTCTTEWIVVEISYDEGLTWEPYWQGYAQVCS